MSALGLTMFIAALALIVATGLPVYAVLLGVSSAFAVIGTSLGAFDWALLTALPSRLVGLLEHDLLQALPLYAFIGALLNRLPLATLLHRGGEHIFAHALPHNGASAELAALGVGALLAPMNGSVGASLHTLSRSVAPALAASGTTPARTTATICVASTLGIVIPPSLVLLLLGDAMMRAHTEAVNVTHAAVRIVNTQDVMRAALLPGAAVLLLAWALVAWRGRRNPPPRRSVAALSRAQALTAASTAVVIFALLAAVAVGWLYAVEAAATGGVLLLAGSASARQLHRTLLRQVLHDTLLLTGLLFALLLGATTFSLLLRAYGTDALVATVLQAHAGAPTLLLAGVLLGLVACSFVLDALEMIFLVIPLVMPPLLAVVPDPAWVAALTLLVLQAGFLLPPFGYAVVMGRAIAARASQQGAVALSALTRALAPHLLLQGLLIVAVLLWPQTTRWLRPADASVPAASADESNRLMQEAFDAQNVDAAASAAAGR